MNQTHLTILVCALGYFVDIYDLILFSIVRVPSLKSLGIADSQLLATGVFLINCQMSGMLLGGILWGILGDKKGRVSVLFGSILLYSLMNIANAYVGSVTTYALCRFFAGLGLAGELGAAITLVSEMMSKEKRGYGTTLVASIGVCGAVFAALTVDRFSWQTAYLIGGCMGLGLLVLRFKLMDSRMFESLKSSTVSRGNLKLLLQPQRTYKYIKCILIGVPVWYVIGILISFSPELSQALGVQTTIKAGTAVMCSYIGTSLGDLLSGLISQWLKSRKKSILAFLLITSVGVLFYILGRNITAWHFYTLCLFLGFGVGYWAVFVMNAAEQFGTNLRATVATSAPNFVRGSVVPLTLSFQMLQNRFSILESALILGIVSLCLAFWATSQLEETYAKDLDYVE